MEGGPPPPGGPDQLPDFYDAVLNARNQKFCALNITMKKGRQLFGEKSAPPEKN